MSKIAGALSVLLIVGGCGKPAPEGTETAAPAGSEAAGAIIALSKQWQAALNGKDIDKLVSFYTSDARVMAPNAEISQGTVAVRAAFGGMIEAGLSGELKTLEARMAGDIGYNIGTYHLKAGNDEVDRGKFIEIWRNVDGQWLISSDIWNSDLPLPQTAADVAMFITHDVADADKWLSAWRGEDSRHDQFLANGAASVQLFQDTADANHTGLAIAVSNLEQLQGFIGSPAGTAAAAEDGVDLESLTVFAPAR